MINRIPVKKSAISLHLEYDKTFTNNVFGFNCEVRVKPEFEIFFDLSPNLRKNKKTDTYIDSQELSEGAINSLTLFQFDDETIYKRLNQLLKPLGDVTCTWTLSIRLEREWTFKVRPEIVKQNDYHSLVLKIQ